MFEECDRGSDLTWQSSLKNKEILAADNDRFRMRKFQKPFTESKNSIQTVANRNVFELLVKTEDKKPSYHWHALIH